MPLNYDNYTFTFIDGKLTIQGGSNFVFNPNGNINSFKPIVLQNMNQVMQIFNEESTLMDYLTKLYSKDLFENECWVNNNDGNKNCPLIFINEEVINYLITNYNGSSFNILH